jgi:hypothetical protein
VSRLRSNGRARGPANWTGAYVPFDPVKVLCIAVGVVALATIALAVLFSSPDQRPSTIAQWAREKPIGFLATADAELGYTSVTAEYGPPYNHASEGQHAAFLHPQRWLGVSHPIDTGKEYVLGPLRRVPDPALQAAIAGYEKAPPVLRGDGNRSFEQSLERSGVVTSDGSVSVPPGEYEHVDQMMEALLRLAQSGGLDGALLSGRQPLQTDYTAPLLFMADGELLEERAKAQHLLGRQWAMMNETGSFPGQPSLWPAALWYQLEPFKASYNADILVMLVLVVLALTFVCVPFLPGIRDIPRLLPLHRLIWREHYRG